jgi:hypothetical protein
MTLNSWDFNHFDCFYFNFVFEKIRLFSGEEIWGVVWIWIFLFSFFDFLDKKLISSTKSGCGCQLSEIIFSSGKNPSDFFIEYQF